MHPANLILCWLWVACWLQWLQPTPLVVSTLLLFALTAWAERARTGRMLRRVRILLLAIVVVYGWSTPGLYVWPGGWAPTHEGLMLGGLQCLRLVAVLCSLQWLLRWLDRAYLFAGIYVLAAPLGCIGINRERWALRLALTMVYAEALLAERQQWRDLWRQLSELDAPAITSRPTVVTLPDAPLTRKQCSLLILLLSGIVLTFIFFHLVRVMRYALAIEYDGRAFCGWQVQPDQPTVQAAVEAAVSRMAGEVLRVHAAGRTDTGVHAVGQVVHFDTAVKRPITAWVRGVNSFLPAGVAVRWAQPVSDDFHARFSAHARHYRYLLLNHPVRPALMAGRVGWVHQPLDLAAIRTAAAMLLGTHDFSSFRAAECQAKTPVKTLRRLDITVSGTMWALDFEADAFLHHMVRNIMGALLHVGKGNESPAWIAHMVGLKDRRLAPPTFMPDGLYLTGVGYPAEFALASEPDPRYGLI